MDPLDEIAQSMYGKDLTDCTPDEEFAVRATHDGLLNSGVVDDA